MCIIFSTGRVRAFGPGLQSGITGKPAKFSVETKGAGTGGLSLAIEGPSEAKMTCIDKRDGSCDVEYLPTEPGEYDITVRFAEKHIPGSPFKVEIHDSNIAPILRQAQSNVVDANKVRVYGQGVTQGLVYEGLPVEFFVDAGNAGPGKIGVKLTATDGKQINDLRVSDRGEGVYAVTFTAPQRVGTILTCNVLFSDKEVPGSPFVVTVEPKADVNLIKISGDITKKKVPASVPVKFQVDDSGLTSGDLSVQITVSTNFLLSFFDN